MRGQMYNFVATHITRKTKSGKTKHIFYWKFKEVVWMQQRRIIQKCGQAKAE